MWGWALVLPLGGRNRSANASTSVITVAKIPAAVEDGVLAVHTERQIDSFTSSQAKGRPAPSRRRRHDT